MFDFLGIRALFQRVAAEREASKARAATFDEAIVAMDAGNVVKVAEIAASTGFSYRQSNTLIMRAIGTDNPDMFNAVLEGRSFKGDVNTTLHFRDSLMIEGPHHWSEASLLYLAISHGKSHVAARLALDPKTDITKSGYSETSTYHSGGFTHSGHVERDREDYISPLELARKMQMNDVVRVLARRIAELKQGEALTLLREAGLGLAPG